MDITETLAPKSDQLDAVDLQATGPRVFTVTGVSKGPDRERPVQVTLAEFPRVWRPSKGMRNVLAAGWTVHSNTWTGRRVRLYCDTEVMFGGVQVGGIRIEAMSDLPDGKPLKAVVLVASGRSKTVIVQPLPDRPTGPTSADVAASTDVDTLRSWWQAASAPVRKEIEARVKELTPAKEGADQ